MDFTKYIGMYQSFIKDSRIHLKQNTISTLESVPHFYKTFTYENRDGVLNTGLFISVKEIINNESEILDIFKDYFKSASINESSYNQVKIDLESLIIDKSVKEKCDFYFPGLAMTDQVVVGVTANGTNHKMAKKVVEQIREMLGECL